MTKRLLLTLSGILVLAATRVNGQPNPNEHPVLTACKHDIARFCSKVPPGQGKVKACMKEHLSQLSEPCKEALFQAWLRD